MNNRKNNIAIPSLFLCFNGAHCLYFAFIVSYLSSKGYGSSYIGLVMTLCCIVNMVTQPIFGYVSETFIPTKYLMLVIATVSIPMGFLLPATVGIPILAALSIIFLSIFQYVGFPLCDMWCVKLHETFGTISYGFVRSCGSFGYAVAALVFGRIFAKIGIDYMFTFHGIGMLMTALIILNVSPVPLANKREKNEENSNISMKQAFIILSKNKKYMMFLASYTFINIGMRFISSFYPVLIELKGGTLDHVGVGLFLMAFSEIPFVWGFNKYKNWFRIEVIMLFALSMFTIRNLSMLLAPNLFFLQLAQITQGLSYGVYIPAFLYYMTYITPNKIATTAVTIVTSVIGAISSLVGTLLGGVMMEYVGANPSVLLCTVLAFIGALIFFASMFVPRTLYPEYDE